MMTEDKQAMETKEQSYLDKFLEDENNWILFEQERLAYAFGEIIETALEASGTPQAAIAQRLKKSPSVISRALNAGSNLTIRTMVEIAGAAGVQIVDFRTREIPAVQAGRGEDMIPILCSRPPYMEGDATLVASSARMHFRGLNAANVQGRCISLSPPN